MPARFAVGVADEVRHVIYAFGHLVVSSWGYAPRTPRCLWWLRPHAPKMGCAARTPFRFMMFTAASRATR